MIQIHLKTSKTQQFGLGVDVVLGTMGTTCTLCPVTAMIQYIAERWDPNRVLSSSAQPNLPSPKPNSYPESAYFTSCSVSLAVIMLVILSGSGSHNSGIHGCGRLDEIQTLGRWHSAAFLQYIRTPKEQLAAISAMLATSSPH